MTAIGDSPRRDSCWCCFYLEACFLLVPSPSVAAAAAVSWAVRACTSWIGPDPTRSNPIRCNAMQCNAMQSTVARAPQYEKPPAAPRSAARRRSLAWKRMRAYSSTHSCTRPTSFSREMCGFFLRPNSRNQDTCSDKPSPPTLCLFLNLKDEIGWMDGGVDGRMDRHHSPWVSGGLSWCSIENNDRVSRHHQCNSQRRKRRAGNEQGK